MANKTKNGRRLDKNRITLKTGESQRSDGTYSYRWTTKDGKRHSVYAATLEELRQKEEETKVEQKENYCQ